MPRKAEPGRLMPARQVIRCERWATRPLRVTQPESNQYSKWPTTRVQLARRHTPKKKKKREGMRMGWSGIHILGRTPEPTQGRPAPAEVPAARNNQRSGFNLPVTSSALRGWPCPVHRIGSPSPRTNGRSESCAPCPSKCWIEYALRE